MSSTGILASPYGYAGGHAMIIVGKKIISNKPHWIVQNSWGSWWGDGGYCYMPCDWGIGCPNPDVYWGPGYGLTGTQWVCCCWEFSSSNITAISPVTPTNLSIAPDYANKQAKVTFNGSAPKYLIIARQRDANNKRYGFLEPWWYIKASPTTISVVISVDFPEKETEYDIAVYAFNSTGKLSNAARETFTGSNRPLSWNWETYPVQGGKISITAANWNAFLARINEFRTYKGIAAITPYPGMGAIQGEQVTAAKYKLAKSFIQGIPGYGTYIPEVNAGDKITAYQFNQIRDELNAIP